MEFFKEYTKLNQLAFVPYNLSEKYINLTGKDIRKDQIVDILSTAYNKLVVDEKLEKVNYWNRTRKITDYELAEKIFIETEIPCVNEGGNLVLLLTKNKNPDKEPWVVSRLLTEKEYKTDIYVDLGDVAKDMLYKFAYWPSYSTDLVRLKSLALAEDWTLKNKRNLAKDNLYILDNYITYTFSKAWTDHLVLLSDNKKYSAFNTGLVTKNYTYIYCVFERNTANNTKWRFLDFCVPGMGGTGRILTNNFSKLPDTITYFNSIEDVSYVLKKGVDPSKQLPELQPEHYFIDHTERLPLHYLKDSCRKNKELLELLDLIEITEDEDELKDLWDFVKTLIQEDPAVYDDMFATFSFAVKKAIMRVSWNYRTAIPVYFPSRNTMSILLPLSFSISGEADVALVVERNISTKHYVAPTILDLTTAYSNARLVCKPESEWLNIDSLK